MTESHDNQLVQMASSPKQDDTDAPVIHISMLNGHNIILDPPVGIEDRVEEVKQRIGLMLEVHFKQIAMSLDGEELKDHCLIREALPDIAGPVALSVILQPCRVKPQDYEAYIDFKAIGVLEVQKIRYQFGHDLIIPDDAPRERNGFVRGEPSPGGGRHLGVPDPNWKSKEESWRDQHCKSKAARGQIQFPEPQDIKINMMPFVMGKIESLPEAYRHYWPLIERCELPPEELGKVGYLTIHESLVPAGQTQRRGGLHIESPGNLKEPGSFKDKRYDWGCGIVVDDASTVKGGIYMASNVSNSCRVWNAQIQDPGSLVGNLGSLEHIRDNLGEGIFMEANQLYWLTDVTPHESMPLENETRRQFFRLVTSSLSAWYPEHSTKNELVGPNTEVTKIIGGSKFN